MNHAITIKDVLITLGIIAGLTSMGIGILSYYTAGMATAPEPNAGKPGCIIALSGLALLTICLYLAI